MNYDWVFEEELEDRHYYFMNTVPIGISTLIFEIAVGFALMPSNRVHSDKLVVFLLNKNSI